MNTYRFVYFDMDTWLNEQEATLLACEVPAPTEAAAIEWFQENVQADYDVVELVEEAPRMEREMSDPNHLAIQGLAITAAAYRCDWTQDTGPDDMQSDFDRICALAQDYLRRARVPSEITHADIRQALWGESDE